MAQIQTAIQAVTVYTDRARVVRRGPAHVTPGVQRLEAPGLPLSLNPDSLRARAKGTARARLLGVQVQRAFAAETQVEQIRELEQQLEAVQDSLRQNETQADLARGSRATLTSLAGHTQVYATALAAGEMSVEDELAMFETLRSRMAQLDAELLDLSARRRELERQQQKLKDELDQWRGTPRRETYTAILEVDVQQAGDLDVELACVVVGAGWQPLYDIRLQETEGSAVALEASYLAEVTQHTGEAWDDVEIVLSTARPALAGRLPELDPWYVRPLPPPRPRMKGPQGAPAPMMMVSRAVYDETGTAPEAMIAEAAPALAEVETSGAAVTYRVPGKASVPADGAPHKVSVAELRLEPRLDYVTAPKLTEAVYRRARMANASPYTLLPGMANLFDGDEFIGSAPLELTAPEAEIELYLGVDDRIRVERELVRSEVDKRLIGSRRRRHSGYEIRLENLLDREASITLQDQIPVAQHEEIKVRLESAEPRPAEQTELNLLKWEFHLPPRGKQVVRFDFSVEYPQEMEVLGLG